MSYRIYSGVRFKHRNLSKALQFYKDYYIQVFVKKIKFGHESYCNGDVFCYDEMTLDYISSVCDYGFKDLEEAKYYLHLCNKIYLYHCLSKANKISPLIFGVNLYCYGKYFYLHPYGNIDSSIILPKYIEEYSFYSNEDHPDGISYGKWRKRFKNWNGALFSKTHMHTEFFNIFTIGEESDAKSSLSNSIFLESIDENYDPETHLFSKLSYIYPQFKQFLKFSPEYVEMRNEIDKESHKS